MENKKVYDFGEKDFEYDSKTGEEIPTWQSPKYIESKKKAIEMIEAEKYNLSTTDFWILMNKTKKGKMAYTGLIISHNGCLKINEAIDNKINPKCFSLDKDGFKNSLVYTYCDDDTYEVGEFSLDNGKNAYPYAMAFKRCFDRVVLKKSKLAFSGIYSEVEADEFKDPINETKVNSNEMTDEQLTIIANLTPDLKEHLTKTYKKDFTKLTKQEAEITIKSLQKRGLIKTKEEEEKERKEREEVF